MKGRSSGSKGRRRSNPSPGDGEPTSASPVSSVLFLIIFTGVFFFAGIFVGSQFDADDDAAYSSKSSAPRIGLPKTFNKIEKWAESKASSYLRAPAAVKSYSTSDLSTEIHASHVQNEPQKVPETLNPFMSTRSLYAHQQPPPPPPTEKISSAIAESSSAGHKLDGTALTSQLKASLHADSLSYMTGPSVLDAESVLVGAWVRLDDIRTNDMRTIFTNKAAGCERTAAQNGFSLYVNAWQTNDEKLYVEYGGQSSGCHKLGSNIEMKPEKWYHVAVYLGPATVGLFIDGSVAAFASKVESHEVQRSRPLLVGQYENSEFPFLGNLSHLAIVQPTNVNQEDSATANTQATLTDTVKSIMNINNIMDTQGLTAMYPLIEASGQKDGSSAVDRVHGNSGAYHFPPPSSRKSFSGLKISLVDGIGGRPVTEEMKTESDVKGKEWAEAVKGAMKRTWSAYTKYAWGRDELLPISRNGKDNWGGMGITLVDSLDTLWLMDMKKEFKDARDWVASKLTFKRAGTVSVFETTIRELGGLLAAYDLSEDTVFLDKANELADLLSPAFNTRSGIPRGQVNLQSHQPVTGWAGSSAILSELGSLQLEFRYLAKHKNRPELDSKVMKAFQIMRNIHPNRGLYPIKVSVDDGHFADSKVTMGALGDSFYEYLLKTWIQGGMQETWLRTMYDEAVDGMFDVMLAESARTGLAFLADWNGHSQDRKMDHLVCFMPGILALGAYTSPNGLDSSRAQRDLAVAKALMYTCREMYHRQPTGIAPEYVTFPKSGDMDVPGNVAFFILRPETAESLFVLHQLTGDPIYRQWAWEIFSAIDDHCRAGDAYGALRNVKDKHSGVDDRMESFWTAELLKYLYLTMEPEVKVDLRKQVFNTEAHPMKILENHKPIL